MKKKFAGVFANCPTPFTADGELDIKSLERLISFQIGLGVHGIGVLGVMGELHKLSSFERRRVIETVVAVNKGQVPIWVGVRGLGLQAVIEQVRSAEGLGADAAFVAPLTEGNDDFQVRYYRAVKESTRLPVIVHDFPDLFKTRFSVELVRRLADEAGVDTINCEDAPVGAKLSDIVELTQNKVSIFGGLGGIYFAEELKRGADGVLTGFSYPEVLVNVYQHFLAGNDSAAYAVFDQFCSLISYEFQPGIALALRKYSYMRRGVIASDALRGPANLIDARCRQEYDALVGRLGLLQGTV